MLQRKKIYFIFSRFYFSLVHTELNAQNNTDNILISLCFLILCGTHEKSDVLTRWQTSLE